MYGIKDDNVRKFFNYQGDIMPLAEAAKIHAEYMELGDKYLAVLKDRNELSDKHSKLLRDHNKLLKQQIYLLKVLKANNIMLPPGEIDAI